MGDDLKPEHLDYEIVTMRVMFVNMVDRIMDNQIDDSDIGEAMMHQSIPPLMTEILRLRESRNNPQRINSYSKIVQSMFPNGVESVQDQSMNNKKKI